ncbi:MAG: undecaprenyl diphosphate synthase family protein [Halobacteriota archaeon]
MNKIPKHIGIIPDGNRRWAVKEGFSKQAGYDAGLPPGLAFLRLCIKAGVKEVTAYGFTQDNTKRAADQRKAFQKACIDGVKIIKGEDVRFLVVGDTESAMFPKELLPYTTRATFGRGSIKVNFLVNYGWQWDLEALTRWPQDGKKRMPSIIKMLRSSDISRIDLVMRWGGRRRLSGFLPVQSVYADFYVIDELWPDFKPEQFYAALDWYKKLEITLGG